MANFLRHKPAGVQSDLSAGIEPQLFVPDEIARYGINSQITTIAFDPVQSLLAVGTHESQYGSGQIYVFGRKRVRVVLKLPRKATVKSLHFCADRLVSVDSKNELVVYSLETRQMWATFSAPGAMTVVLTDPCLDWVFVGLQSGETVIYDLDRKVLAPLRIPYLWREKNPRGRLLPVVSLALHPRDIGQLLVGYSEGAAIFSFKQNRAVKFFQYELSPGAPGGDSDPASMRKIRHPRLSQAIWHPGGTFILTGHEDSSMVFWDVRTCKIICARTLQDSDVHLVGASTGTVGVSPGTYSLKEPLFRIAWCAKSNAEDTALLIAGGAPTSLSTKGLTYLDLGPTPVYATSSWQILADYFNAPKRQRILPTPPQAEVVDFCLLPETSPHYAGAHEAVAVIALLSSGETVTLAVPSGHPISPTNHLHLSVSFVHPFIDTINVTQVERTKWLGMVEHRQDGPPLLNGGAEMHHPLKRFASRNIMQAAHADGTVRLWDIGHADEIENPDVIQVDVAMALGRLDHVDVTKMSMSGVTGEFVVGLATGEVVVFRWGGNKHFNQTPPGSPERSPGLMSIANRADPNLREGLLPLTMLDPQQGPVTAVTMSDVGFVAVGFESGNVTIIDLRGPAVIYSASIRMSTPPPRRASIVPHRPTSHQQGSGASSEHITALEFCVMTLDGDDYSSVLLLAGTSHARLHTHKLLPSPSGGFTVAATPSISLPSPYAHNPIISISAFNPTTGLPISAHPSMLAALRTGSRFTSALLVTSQSSVYILSPPPSTNSSHHSPKPTHRDFDSISCHSASLVSLSDPVLGDRVCLVGIFGDGTTRCYSIPSLRELARADLSQTLDVARLTDAHITSDGSILSWRGPSEISALNVWGTGQSSNPPPDRLVNPEASVPPRPTISNLQWIAGTQYVSPADMDLLIGGPDRLPSQQGQHNRSTIPPPASSSSNPTATTRSTAPTNPPSTETWSKYMTRQLAERTEKLNLVGESMDGLQENSARWANDVSRYVGSAKKKVLIGAAKSSLGL